ncbi:NTP binding protein (Contains STAS domain) [Pasteurella skyensis]|uniref:STAS domain-containing protein n=1 Tax=Phocoenobacter skyensis TaxID=97481 RepID=UPI00276FFFC4|nr:STAS domain-containing protein [Pasteurella skyensis]MDP8177761.1 NTP binding protein (Contains STAS domain) [Pasteurella skyensis]MDP8200352.1 NTP binding protein (Contains STAS domain) [Pasteurella skyensis]
MKLPKPLHWNIQQDSDSLTVVLSGNLIRDTLSPIWEQRASFLTLTSEQSIYWDLGQISAIDSAGLTLLIELLHFYSKTNVNRVINVPDSIFDLAQLFDLQEWLDQFTE